MDKAHSDIEEPNKKLHYSRYFGTKLKGQYNFYNMNHHQDKAQPRYIRSDSP